MRVLASFITSRVSREQFHRTFKTRLHKPFYTGFHKLIGRNNYGTAATTGSTIIDQPQPAPPGLEVKVTSREMIKPSSPTPRHLKTLKFSLLDQLSPDSVYNPTILFYQNDPNNEISQQTTLLKKSLSQTLTNFYPLAGRIQDNSSIDCNDDGVEFCEAQVSETLLEVIQNPNLDNIGSLLPFQGLPRHKDIVLSVQLTRFSCGGLAISMCISHKIADGTSTAYFIKSWANKATYDGHADIARPSFNAASIIPPLKDLNEILTGDGTFKMSEEKVLTKRLVFSKDKLRELRARSELNSVNKPTRVELVSAFIWNHLVETAAVRPDMYTNFTTALHAVDLRSRMVPPLPESCFGNFAWLARTSRIDNNNKITEEMMINLLRRSISKIDYDYVKPFLSCERHVPEVRKETEYLLHGLDNCIHFTSLCGFPVYEIDFGIGLPVWACLTTSPVSNMVILLRTKCGQGIEAWFHLRQPDIAMLDHLHLT